LTAEVNENVPSGREYLRGGIWFLIHFLQQCRLLKENMHDKLSNDKMYATICLFFAGESV